MKHIGLDGHKRWGQVSWFDTETGELSEPERVPNDELVTELTAIPGEKRVVIEAGPNTYYLTQALREAGLDVRVVDAFKAHRLFEALREAKTDKLDAQGLALLSARGSLDHAEVWVPDETIRQWRELTRARAALTRLSTMVRNHLRKLLVRQGVECPYRDLTGVRAQQWLDEEAARWPQALQAVLAGFRAVLATLAEQVKQLAHQIVEHTQTSEPAERLQTIPGVGPQLAAAVVAEIGAPERFPTAIRLRGYSGLVPQVRQSGERRWTGPLIAGGNRHLRWALVEIAQHFVQSRKTQDLALVRWYRRLVHRRGPNPAKVALARRLLTIIFAMLRDGTPFEAERYARSPDG